MYTYQILSAIFYIRSSEKNVQRPLFVITYIYLRHNAIQPRCGLRYTYFSISIVLGSDFAPSFVHQ